MNLKIKILIGILITGIVFVPGWYSWRAQAETIQITIPGKAIDVHLPIKIKEVRYYKENGGIDIKIEDNLRKSLLFHLSVEIHTIKADLAQKQRTEILYSNIYMGGRPGSLWAHKLPIGGAEEKTILKILQSWVGDNPEEGLIKKLMKESGLNSKSDAKFNLQRILEFIKILQNR